jgi:hypothetical protein
MEKFVLSINIPDQHYTVFYIVRAQYAYKCLFNLIAENTVPGSSRYFYGFR